MRTSRAPFANLLETPRLLWTNFDFYFLNVWLMLIVSYQSSELGKQIPTFIDIFHLSLLFRFFLSLSIKH